MRSLIIAAGLSLALFAGPATAGVPSVNMQFHELVVPECSPFDAVCIRQHMLTQQGDPTNNQCFRHVTCYQAPTRPDPLLAPRWWQIKPAQRKVA